MKTQYLSLFFKYCQGFSLIYDMESIPEEISKGAQPLAFAVGHFEDAVNIGDKVVESIVSTANDSEHLRSIVFKVVPYDHEFLMRKPVQSGSGSVSTDGILKANWLVKHHSLLPSVVLLLFPFNSEWVDGEQTKRENFMVDTYSNIKAAVSGRDVKILVLIVCHGPSAADGADKDAIEERHSAFKRRVNLDSKSLFIYSESADFSPQSSMARKLGKAVRECSNTYYKFHCKNYRKLEKLGTKAVQPLLFARYNFKAAVYCDFLGQTDKSLKHYQDSFYALANFSDGMKQSDFDQLDIVAGYLNYRISRLLLLTSSINDVTHQFRVHLNLYGRRYRGDNFWKHYSWLASQYLIYEGLLNANSVNPQAIDTDKKFFYLNAAKYTLKTSIECQKLAMVMSSDMNSESLLEDDLRALYPGLEIRPPIYCGGMPHLFDRGQGRQQLLTKDGEKVVAMHWLREEAKKDHSSVIYIYLNTALETLQLEEVRTRQHIQTLIADQVHRGLNRSIIYLTFFNRHLKIKYFSSVFEMDVSTSPWLHTRHTLNYAERPAGSKCMQSFYRKS